jgi:NAD(P)-dependent dehydrogenase (short-subunit alcohol dehydrogenase family)
VTLLVGSAFVTGGGSGIGRAIAQALAAHGAPVAVMDLLPEGGKDAVAAIAAKGGRATFVQGDVGRWDELDRAVAAAVRELGPLGIMVNAAGVLDGYAPADEIGAALWERVIGINLTGTFYGCKRALAEMLPVGRGPHHQHRVRRRLGGLGRRRRVHGVQAWRRRPHAPAGDHLRRREASR